jgi:hypothetical protein
MLRIVRAEGEAEDRGFTIGRELGDVIHRSLEFYRGYLAERGLAGEGLARAVAAYREAAEEALPEETALLDAVAAGADADPVEVWAVNALEELEALTLSLPERCSTFTAVGPGMTMLAHNEQWLAGDAGNVAVIVEVPRSGVAVVSPTVACCLPAVGLNAHGVAQGIDSLTARDDGIGIPRVLVSRHALAARDRGDAVRRATVSGRAGGYAHMFAVRGGAFAVETTARRHAVLGGPGAHTNHYLAPSLGRFADDPGDGSVARYRRLTELLRERRPASPEAAMELLADHGSSPQAICEHGGESTVLFSVVCEVGARRIWVAPGNPCETPFEPVDWGDAG